MNKDLKWLVFFGVALLSFAFFSKQINFHDTAEYITIAKYFAGIRNVDIFTAHSLLYPLVISFFLLFWKSLIMIKIVNVFWIFLMGTVLLLWTKNRKAFLLFGFSPLVWYVSVQTTPILPASFFFLLAFLFFNSSSIKWNKTYSGIMLGISCAFYTPMILVSFFFLLIFFWKEKFSDLVKYLISIGFGFLPRMILDFYLFGMPFYSFLRYVGANFIVSIGLNPNISNFEILKHLKGIFIFFIMSPLLFKLYKFEFRKYKEITLFLLCISLIFLVRATLWKYFLIILPIFLIALSKILNEKEIKLSCLLSLIITIFLTWNFFAYNSDFLIQQDLKKIVQDYSSQMILGGPMESLRFAALSDSNSPYFIWWEDYEISLKNGSVFRSYIFGFDSKIPLNNQLKILAVFERSENKNYDKEKFILVSEKNFSEIENFKQKKCYEKLCVYENE